MPLLNDRITRPLDVFQANYVSMNYLRIMIVLFPVTVLTNYLLYSMQLIVVNVPPNVNTNCNQHSHQGCQCDDAFFGDHCEYIKGMPKSSLVDNGSQRDVGSKVGITLSVLTGVAIIFGILIGRRRRRQLQSSASEPWGRRGHTSHSFYEENLATGKDSNQGNRDQGTESQAEMKEIQFGGTSKEEGDLQSMLSSIDSSKPEVYEAGAKSYFA